MRTLAEGKVLSNLEVEFTRPDGETLALVVNCIPLKAPDGRVAGGAGHLVRHHLAALSRGRARSQRAPLALLFKSPSMGIFSGRSRTITDPNRPFLSLLGYSRKILRGPDQLAGTDPAEFSGATPEL